MAPIKSSLARSVAKLLGVAKDTDLSLRGAIQSNRFVEPPVKATGGNKVTSGDYTYHIFQASVPGPTYSKTPNTSETFIANESLTVDYLIIGGGGAGGHTPSGNTGGGGGGAGGVQYKTSVSLSAATYPVTVGGGGQSVADSPGAPASVNNGDPSVFNSVTAPGGGAGGRGEGTAGTGADGASSGGGGAGQSSTGSAGSATGASHPGGNNVASPGTGFGRAGGAGGSDASNLSGGGGGGGAGGTGGTGQSGSNPPGYSQGGAGGIGVNYTIYRGGSAQLTGIAGGGAGGSYSKTGVDPDAFDSGGGIMDYRDWSSPMLIYPTTSQRYGGLDGTGGGGTGGASNPGYVPGGSDPSGPPYTTRSGRGGCGLVQIRYLTA